MNEKHWLSVRDRKIIIQGYRIPKFEYFQDFHVCVIEIQVFKSKYAMFLKQGFCMFLSVKVFPKELVLDWTGSCCCAEFV